MRGLTRKRIPSRRSETRWFGRSCLSDVSSAASAANRRWTMALHSHGVDDQMFSWWFASQAYMILGNLLRWNSRAFLSHTRVLEVSIALFTPEVAKSIDGFAQCPLITKAVTAAVGPFAEDLDVRPRLARISIHFGNTVIALNGSKSLHVVTCLDKLVSLSHSQTTRPAGDSHSAPVPYGCVATCLLELIPDNRRFSNLKFEGIRCVARASHLYAARPTKKR